MICTALVGFCLLWPINDYPRNAPINGVCMQNLHPHEVDGSTRFLEAHILSPTSSPRVSILDPMGFPS